MNISRTFALALVGAMTMTGCVSIETLDQDLKSNDVKKQSAAVQNMSDIVTNGKVFPFSTYSSADRLWCAKHITDKDEIAKIVETMSQMRRDPQAPQEVNDALMGMYSDVNAPIIEALLTNLGNNKKIAERLSQGDIGYAPKVYNVVQKYVEAYVESVDDMGTLYAMENKYKNWRNIVYDGGRGGNSYELQKDLDERILPKRIVALIASTDDVNKFLSEFPSHAFKEQVEVAIGKVDSQKDLFDLLHDFKRDAALRSLIMARITDPDILYEIALNEEDATKQYRGSSAGEMALEKISDKTTLVRIALLAKNEVVYRRAKEKVGDKKSIVDGLADLLSSKKLSEKEAESHVEGLNVGEATIVLYNATQGQMLKQMIFSKLCEADRKTVREGNAAKCRQMIESAKDKAKETFEMGGFYLGMDISDVDMLVGYYFPEWSTKESIDNDEKDIRVIYVPQQSRPFCRADKAGKVWQFNFGRNFLKKFFKYDVQDEREWVRAYSKEHGIDMKHVFLNKDTTVADLSGNFDVTTYKAWLNQDTWQWKNNAKRYRLIYFAEPEIETLHGDIVKERASYQFRFISSDAGTLRATIEND